MAAKILTCIVFVYLSLFFLLFESVQQCEASGYGDDARINRQPTVLVAILVRNKAHTLPYFFGHLERLQYPKERMALW